MVRAGMLAAAILPAMLFVLPSAADDGKGAFTGVLLEAGEAAGGIFVEAHREARGDARTEPAASTVTGSAGRYELSLSPGEYHITYREEAVPPDPPRIVEHPENPLVLGPGETKELAAVDIAEEGVGPPGSEVTGRIVSGGVPVAGASVMFYDGGKARLVGPGFRKITTSGEDGTFRVRLSPGNYGVSARKRARGAGFGPPAPGDLVGEHEGNPLSVGEGDTDIGDLALHLADLAKLSERLGRLDNPSPAATTIAGKVLDTGGKPLAARFVFLYRKKELTGRPLFVTRSRQDGSFVLNVPEGGRFYLTARERYGVQRELGEPVGLLEGRETSSVEVAEGDKIDGLVIRMEQR